MWLRLLAFIALLPLSACFEAQTPAVSPDGGGETRARLTYRLLTGEGQSVEGIDIAIARSPVVVSDHDWGKGVEWTGETSSSVDDAPTLPVVEVLDSSTDAVLVSAGERRTTCRLTAGQAGIAGALSAAWVQEILIPVDGDDPWQIAPGCVECRFSGTESQWCP